VEDVVDCNGGSDGGLSGVSAGAAASWRKVSGVGAGAVAIARKRWRIEGSRVGASAVASWRKRW
jgi:hypothetical protein